MCHIEIILWGGETPIEKVEVIYMPEISVIVPVYKVEKYLHRCVDSILPQTFTDFELILVDDGSPDKCGSICDEYAEKDPRVRVIHKPNGGVSSARNAGIDAAQGNWITFVDSDDYVTETYLEDLYEPEYDLTVIGHIHYNLLHCTNEEKHLIPFSTLFINTEVFTEIIESNGKYWLLFCWGRLYRKNLIYQYHIQFDENLTVGEDYVFSIQYLSHCTSIILKKNLCYFHIDYGCGTLSKTFDIPFFESLMRSEKIINKVMLDAYDISSFGKTENELITIFTDALFSITANSYLSFVKKYKIIDYLFHSTYFLKGVQNPERYFCNTSKKFQILIKTKCPLLVLCALIIRTKLTSKNK